MGSYHARFLGDWARATAPGYPPAKDRKFKSGSIRTPGVWLHLGVDCGPPSIALAQSLGIMIVVVIVPFTLILFGAHEADT